MERKIFKWTAALAVALTLAGGAAGLSPSPVSLSDYSITAEAASHYSFDKQTHQLTLSGTFTFSEDGLASALGNYTASGVDSLKLKEGANVTFDEDLKYYLPSLTYVDLSNATVNYTDSSGYFLGSFEKLKIAKLDGTIYNGSWGHMFYDCPRLVTADLEISYDSRVIDTLESCFKGCSMLQNIHWNNNFQANLVNVTNMSYMFDGCSSLTYESLMNIARLSNNKLYNARAMFRNCSSLTELRLWDMNLSNVGVIDSMFEGCSSLETLNLSGLNANNFDFTNYNRWEKMFLGCTSLHTLKLPANFKVLSKMGLPNAGEGCPEDLTGWAQGTDLYTSVTNGTMAYIDAYYENIANQKSSVSFTEPFTLYRRGDWIDKGSCYYCDRVNYVLHLFGNVDRDEVVYMNNANKVTEVWCEEGTVFPDYCFKLFAHRPNLKKVDINNADTSGVGDMSYMFTDDPSLEEINAGKIDTSNVYTMEYMFASCSSLKYFYNNSYGGSWDTNKVKYFNRMFASCTSLREMKADFGSNVITSVEGMFSNCPDLYIVVLNNKGFNLQGVADEKKANMFEKCPSLQMLYLPSNFGGITQNMKLRNDGGGWCDPMWNGNQVSGTTPYAVINTESSWTIYHAEKFSVINLDQTFTVSDAPVVGFTNYGLEEGVTCNSTAFKIDKDLSGWYDASTDKKMKTEFFQPGGAYYLRILLKPAFQYRFDGITAENIAKIKLKFTYKDKQFADVVAAGVTVNGLLDIYAVVDSGSKTSAISMTEGSFEGAKEQIYRKDLPSYCVFKYNYSSSQQFLHCYKLPILTCTAFCFTNYYDARFLYPTYLEYVGLEMDDYEYSIGDRAYKPFTVSSAWIPTGVLPGTEYKVAFRRKNQSKPFTYWYIVSRSIGEPVEDKYMTATDVKHFDLTFSAHTVALNSNLGAVYYIPVSDLEGYENIKVIIQKESYDKDGNLFYTIEEIKDYTIRDEGYGDEYVFAYNNVAAKEIASNLYAVIYAEKDGNVYTNMYDRYSVVDYAIKKLNSAKTPRALAVLCADMLNYGTAAQTYFKYNTANPANGSMTAAHQALATNPKTLQLKSDEKLTPLNGTVRSKFSGKSVALGSNVSVVFSMQFDDDVNLNDVSLKLTYKTIKGETVNDTVPFSEFVKCTELYEGKPEYQYSYKRVRAKDASQPVTAVILINGTPASDTLTYSVQSYAKKKLDNSATPAGLKTMIEALMVYCKSAESFFKS